MNKLTFCNRNEAIARMNRLGKERTRFFFLMKRNVWSQNWMISLPGNWLLFFLR